MSDIFVHLYFVCVCIIIFCFVFISIVSKRQLCERDVIKRNIKK